MKVLWILPKWPHPSYDGATKAHMSLLENFPAHIQLDIVVYSPAKSEEEISAFKKITGAREIKILPLEQNSKARALVKSFLSGSSLPATVLKFCSSIVLSEFNSWKQNQTWDCIVFDGLHPCSLYHHQDHFHFPRDSRIIYRAHNIETELWQQVESKSRFPLNLIYKNESRKMKIFEKDFLEACNLVATVSRRDEQKLKTLAKIKSSMATPIGMSWPKEFPPMKEKVKILFVGRLDWWPNNEGLHWFFNKVWPKVSQSRSDIELDVVGGYAESALIEKMKTFSNVHYLGRVEDLSAHYLAASLTLIPIWTGSGTRVKAIESAQHGRSFLTTSKGIEGVELSPSKDYLLDDSAEGWIQKLIALNADDCKKLGFSVFESASAKYDQKKIQNDLVAAMEKLK